MLNLIPNQLASHSITPCHKCPQTVTVCDAIVHRAITRYKATSHKAMQEECCNIQELPNTCIVQKWKASRRFMLQKATKTKDLGPQRSCEGTMQMLPWMLQLLLHSLFLCNYFSENPIQTKSRRKRKLNIWITYFVNRSQFFHQHSGASLVNC